MAGTTVQNKWKVKYKLFVYNLCQQTTQTTILTCSMVLNFTVNVSRQFVCVEINDRELMEVGN